MGGNKAAHSFISQPSQNEELQGPQTLVLQETYYGLIEPKDGIGKPKQLFKFWGS